MGTCNFSIPTNARAYYVIESDDFCNPIEDIHMMAEALELDCTPEDETVRSYYSNDKTNALEFRDSRGDLWAKMHVQYMPGYYEAGNLDYDIEIDGYSLSNFDGIDDMAQELAENYLTDRYGDPIYNAGMMKIQTRNQKKRFLAYLNELAERMEDVLKSLASETLIRAATFSNGEAIYLPANA